MAERLPGDDRAPGERSPNGSRFRASPRLSRDQAPTSRGDEVPDSAAGTEEVDEPISPQRRPRVFRANERERRPLRSTQEAEAVARRRQELITGQRPPRRIVLPSPRIPMDEDPDFEEGLTIIPRDRSADPPEVRPGASPVIRATRAAPSLGVLQGLTPPDLPSAPSDPSSLGDTAPTFSIGDEPEEAYEEPQVEETRRRRLLRRGRRRGES